MTDIITDIGIYLSRIILPMNICFGIIGNSLNIIVLTRPILRKYASTHYFLALAFNNLFGSTFILIITLLSNGYHIDLSTISLISCKIIRYFYELCPVLSSYYIVLASVDRYFISSLNVNRRRLSNVKMARWMIILITSILALIYISTPVLVDLDKKDKLGCIIRSKNIYYHIYPFIQVVIFNILSPCFMILFGVLAILNTKRIHVHPVHITHYRRTERQLGFMLLIQVSSFILLNAPACVMYIVMLFIPDGSLTPIILFIYLVLLLLQQLSYTTPFLLYIVTGHIFRKELIRLIYKMCKQHCDHQIQPVTNNQLQTNIRHDSAPAIMLKNLYRP